jgi:Fe-S cluster assembly protein SufD
MDMQSVSNYREEFAQLAPQFPGAKAKWLRELRLHALENFEATGYPGTRLEDWKYTNVSPIARRAFRFAAPPLEDVQQWTAMLPDTDGDRLVFINGKHVPALSHVRPLAAGAIVTNMADAQALHVCQIQEMLTAEPANGFASLNAAFWRDGAYIALADGITLEQPIHLVFLCTEAGLACNLRNVVRAGAGSRVTVIEHYLGAADDAYFTNAVTHLQCDDGAQVEHYRVQEESPRAFHIASVDVRQECNSSFASRAFAFGAQLSRTDIATGFFGEGCHATLNGLYVASGRQHMDHHTRIDHLHPRGTSREYYKGVLDDAARAVFNGKVLVHMDAQQSDAAQSNRNLLLSADAEIDTKPQLEIYADDVKCIHGATVGQLDENQVFYLRSRGVDDDAARQLLTHAFANEIVAQVGIDSLRQRLELLLRKKLGDDKQ